MVTARNGGWSRVRNKWEGFLCGVEKDRWLGGGGGLR